jgi:hypothetical protein
MRKRSQLAVAPIPNLQVTSPHCRYYFDVDGPGENNTDRRDALLPSDEAAFEYAKRIIDELQKSGGYDDPAYMVVVRYQNGEVAFSIPF